MLVKAMKIKLLTLFAVCLALMCGCSEIEPADASLPSQTEPTVTTAQTTSATQELTEPTLPSQDEEPAAEPDDDAECVIALGGDTSVDGEFSDIFDWYGIDWGWKEISPIFNAADIGFVNLETCVSERGVSEKREGFGFRTPPNKLPGFVDAGIDIVNLANNHTRDFGYDALLDTFDHLTEHGIEYIGAGRDYDEASALKIMERNGIKVGFVGYNSIMSSGDWYAGEDKAGIAGLNDSNTKAFLQDLEEYDKQCDVLIVSVHWGLEETYELTSYQQTTARAFIDAGADVIIGHHPHVLQAIEFYKDKPILYSIGNLIFWHIDDDLDGLSSVFELTVNKNGYVGLKLNPIFIKNYTCYLLSEDSERYKKIIEKQNETSNKFGVFIAEDGTVSRGEPQEYTASEDSEQTDTAP